ncbi:F-box only protein 6-like [Rana temporaria]|uniref:F-box only protein 6-like n=1 Tax=Rana temporaria TaxID=8407 RepID=UPI001AADE919|nr:F-box only protein 6-like [Rana temporaria]
MWGTNGLKRNLIKNPSALEGLQNWSIDENGGSQWKVEDLPGGEGEMFPNTSVQKYFVTSNQTCKKSQLIDLKKEGFSAEILDKFQPAIIVTDWYAARKDCSCQYELLVRLLSEDKKTIQEFHPQPVNLPQRCDGQWHYVTHTFSNYGPGVRYISFQHGGKDTLNWAGWYGVRVSNSSISVDI